MIVILDLDEAKLLLDAAYPAIDPDNPDKLYNSGYISQRLTTLLTALEKYDYANERVVDLLSDEYIASLGLDVVNAIKIQIAQFAVRGRIIKIEIKDSAGTVAIHIR